MNDLRTLCRTCGTTINKELDTRLFEEISYHLVTLIEDITDMLIEDDNTLPEHICISCKSILDQIVKFRASCLDTHKKLLAEKIKIINSTTDMATVLAFDKISVIEESYNSHDELHQANIKLNSESHIHIKESETPIQSKRLFKCKKINTPKKPSDRHTSSKTWICEQCGGEFRCSTYLKLHMLRHTGTKEFECDICKSRYYTKNEMQRHKILHTNARPYSCRFCNKTFRGTSSKAVHERTHTNERPFACQYCDKAFTSTSVRKMHERVHVNHRNYHCEPCDQWFLRPSHLLLHQRTKLHKSKTAGD
ncbi:transcription factor Ouib-like [Drosophila montana]|uniref:transcription factor Ouib-like n=1 Tax=Drosophila montana TaxID=40370 RepID=UPI00313ED192